VLKSLVLGHLVAQAATGCRVTVHSPHVVTTAGARSRHAAGPGEAMPNWLMGPASGLVLAHYCSLFFYFQNFISELNSKKICPKLQKSIENGIKLRKYEINFIVFLFSRPIHWA
jgi:hypothetical protein